MQTVKFVDNLNPHQAQQRKWLRKSANPAIASAFLAILLYAVTLGGTYVYDDVAIVQNDPRVHQPPEWIRLWTTDYFDGGIDNLYRPIVSSSYAIEWWLHGDRPWIFHLVNILMHALAAASIAEFTRRVLRNNPVGQSAALSAGLLFAAHPIHVEAVANIVGRAELICTTFIFTALILLCERPLTIRRVIVILFIGMIAVLSKEQGILQPLLWLLFGIIIWRSIESNDPATISAEAPNPAAIETHTVKVMAVTTTWIWAAYLIIREHFLKFEWDRASIDPILQPLILSYGSDRLMMPIVLFGHYTALLLWPLHLSADYGGNVIGSIAHLSDRYLWIGLLSAVTWIMALLICLKKLLPHKRQAAGKDADNASVRAGIPAQSSAGVRGILFCLLGLAVTYGMVGNIVTLMVTNFAERLMYLPSAFFLIVIGILIAHIRLRPQILLLTILLTLASIRTVTAARNWNHPQILFRNGLENQPKSAQLRILLSQQYHFAGDRAKASALLRDLCDEYPNYWQSWMFRCAQDMDDGDLADADTSLKRAIDLKADMKLIILRDRLSALKTATQPTTKP